MIFHFYRILKRYIQGVLNNPLFRITNWVGPAQNDMGLGLKRLFFAIYLGFLFLNILLRLCLGNFSFHSYCFLGIFGKTPFLFLEFENTSLNTSHFIFVQIFWKMHHRIHFFLNRGCFGYASLNKSNFLFILDMNGAIAPRVLNGCNCIDSFMRPIMNHQRGKLGLYVVEKNIIFLKCLFIIFLVDTVVYVNEKKDPVKFFIPNGC